MSGVAARTRSSLPIVALLGALALLGLGGCASTGASGEGVVTSIDAPSEVSAVPLSSTALAAIVEPRKAAFAKAAKAFRTCDRKVAADTNKAYACLKKAAAETAVVDDALVDLGSVQVSAEFTTTVQSMQRLSAAGALVAARCTKGDQKCDQALARFRAEEQSLLWDLDLKL